MKPKNLREALLAHFSAEDVNGLTKSFDIVGDIAIVEIPEEHAEKKDAIGKAIIAVHGNVKTVLMKGGEREGEFRLRDYEYIAGEKRSITLHREHGCIFHVDVAKAYFSPRESTERQRIAGLVKPDENVLVMFAGVGPFAIVIAKKSKTSVAAIELNPDAFRFMEENVRLNKLQGKVAAMHGDVRDICKDYGGKFDRVLMPLPKGAKDFLGTAIRCLKDGGTLHYYSWEREGADIFTRAEQEVAEAAKGEGRKTVVMDRIKVLPYAPRTWKICLDCRIT